MSGKKLSNIRHITFQIIAQLPDDDAEALRILDYAKRIILQNPVEQRGDIVPLKVVDA